VKILEVLPTYPGEPYDGSAVYERALNRALLARGATIEVLTTTAKRLRHDRMFSIAWPHDLPPVAEHEGVTIRRFPALDTSRVGKAVSDAVTRRLSREDFREGVVASGSIGFSDAAVALAKSRPARYDLLADIGRGPLVPRLLWHLVRHVSSFDVVLAGYAPFSLPRQVQWAARRSGVPVALLPFIHESDRYHNFASLFRSYESAAVVFTLSPHTSTFLRRYLPAVRPVTLGAGVTTSQEGAPTAAEFRAKYGLGDGPLILYVGRKEHSKRYELAVDAVDSLTTPGMLVMVGRDADGVP
jgi:glycosyltransferase involved in cell wall biosynthesis